MQAKDTQTYSRRLFAGAFLISAVYIGGLVWLGWGRWCQLQTKDLNEVGDFLAGAFSPLAFFWLVVGYFQQGRELSQNTEALLLQHNVMQASVQQAKELVEAAKLEQAASRERWIEERNMRKAERAVKIVPSGQSVGTAILSSGGIGSSLALQFRNVGGIAVNLKVSSHDRRVETTLHTTESADRGHPIHLALNWDPTKFADDPDVVTISIAYTDSDGDDIVDEFVVNGNWRSNRPRTYAVHHSRTTFDW